MVPVHDQGEYLPAAVTSALACGHPQVEVVVVDDESTDQVTVAAVAAVERLAGVTVVRQPNRGLPAARNTGIARARGNYVVPLDADDLLPSGFVGPAVAALDHDPRIGCVGGYVHNFGLVDAVHPPLGYVPDVSLVVNTTGRATAVFRREALEQVGGYDETLPGYEDWDLYIRLHKAGYAVEVAPLAGHLYRRHHESMTFRHTTAIRVQLTQQLVRRHADLLTGERAMPLLLTLVHLWKTRYEPSVSAELQEGRRAAASAPADADVLLGAVLARQAAP